MKKIALFVVALLQLLCIADATAQMNPNVVFNYDDNGNRTSVNYIMVRVDESDLSDDLLSDVSNTSSSINVSIYPNPTTGYIALTADNNNSSQTIIAKLISAQGNTIEDKKIVQYGTEFDLSQLPSGLYFIYLESDDEKQLWKIIKR